MTKDSNGILNMSHPGGCSNYNPNKNKPKGVRAHDVKEFEIYECLNCEPVAGKRIFNCGIWNTVKNMKKEIGMILI